MVYLITSNQDKYEEFKSFIPDLKRIDLDLSEIQETDAEKIIKEKLKKAREENKEELIVEDTSLYLGGLNGLPGPLVKWFEKKIGNEGIYWLTRRLNNNKARAKTIIGYYEKEEIKFFEGIVEGEIVSPAGKNNFGWDPIFRPEGYDKTFAEMSKQQKNEVSMRRKALQKLKDYLED